MAIQRRFCANHPERPAIGVCVITQQAICAECSTRYEGVNYSKEGLRILQARRKASESGAHSQQFIAAGLLLVSPVMAFLMYLYYNLFVDLLITVLHRG